MVLPKLFPHEGGQSALPSPPKRVVVSNKEIGDRIRVLRAERGLTQIELGERIDMTQPNLSAIERGKRGVTIHQIVKIARALGASTDEMLLPEKAPAAGKRPKKRLMRQVARLHELSDRDQRLLAQVLDSFLAGADRKRQASRTADRDSRVA